MVDDKCLMNLLFGGDVRYVEGVIYKKDGFTIY